MVYSGCVKYSKWIHILELFKTLHVLTYVHTEQIWHNNVRWGSGKENRAKVMIFCSKLYIERLLTFTTYNMYNEHKPRTKLQKSFPSTVYTERLLIFPT